MLRVLVSAKTRMLRVSYTTQYRGSKALRGTITYDQTNLDVCVCVCV